GYAAVQAVHLVPGDTVVIAGAAGGVGSIAVQPARRAGATVLGIAGPSNDAWLADHGTVPVNYGDNLPDRLQAAAKSGRIDALLDFFGGGYVAMAVQELGLPPEKVNTVADFEAVKRFGVQSKGGADAATAAALAELADLIARGELEVPIAGVFALDNVREAFRELELPTRAASWCCGRERWVHLRHRALVHPIDVEQALRKEPRAIGFYARVVIAKGGKHQTSLSIG